MSLPELDGVIIAGGGEDHLACIFTHHLQVVFSGK
jgi:hypothetical protein